MSRYIAIIAPFVVLADSTQEAVDAAARQLLGRQVGVQVMLMSDQPAHNSHYVKIENVVVVKQEPEVIR